MILVDFSHLSMRNLYIAISQAKPKKVDRKYKTDDFISFYYHLMLSSLRFIQKKFGQDYGEIILAIDDRNNWRRGYYPEYKKHRSKARNESDVNFEEFFEKQNEFIEVINKNFPYKVLFVENAEADDIIGVLSSEADEPTIVISSDKDMRQVLENKNVKLFDPIKQTFIRATEDELKEFKLLHILLGDSSDNIPNIKVGTEFSEAFKSYLKKNDIFINDPNIFFKLAISEQLIKNYDVFKKNRKGEVTEEKDIFKTPRFGQATAKKFMENLKENLKNPLLRKNFQRNKKLILFSEIPEDVKEKIKEEYAKLENKYNPNGIVEFLTKQNLKEQMLNVTDFYIVPHFTETSVNEWGIEQT